MPEAGEAAPEVRTEVAPEEPESAELAPLTHVHELVGEEATVPLVATSQEDPSADGHPRHPGREHGHHHDAGSPPIALGDMGVVRLLVERQAPRHRRGQPTTKFTSRPGTTT